MIGRKHVPAEIVKPKRCVSQPGMIRSAPSGQPMYQSGWEPAVTSDGL